MWHFYGKLVNCLPLSFQHPSRIFLSNGKHPRSQQIFIFICTTTVVGIFPNVCLWRRSLCSNLAGIDPEKLYRAIFIRQYGLCCCIGPRFCSTDCKNLSSLQNFFGQMVYRPPWQKIARTPMNPTKPAGLIRITTCYSLD